MIVLLRDSSGYYNLVDYALNRSCNWSVNIPSRQDLGFTLDSWPSAKLPPIQRVNYLINDHYTIVSIDDIPFAEWSAQHPEYFI